MSETATCPKCLKPVAIGPEEERARAFTFVAHWAFHNSCWDKLLEEHPVEPLGPEFEKVLFDNLWDLYAR